jgi:hypothetical protein
MPALRALIDISSRLAGLSCACLARDGDSHEIKAQCGARRVLDRCHNCIGGSLRFVPVISPRSPGGRMGVPAVSRSTVVIASAHLFLLMSLMEVHAQDCGCRKIADPRARAACVRGCSSGGTFQPQSTFQLQSTGRSLVSTGSSQGASTGSSQGGSSVGPAITLPPGTRGGSPAPPAGSRGGRR